MLRMSLPLLTFHSFTMLLAAPYKKKCKIFSIFRKYLFHVNSSKITISDQFLLRLNRFKTNHEKFGVFNDKLR